MEERLLNDVAYPVDIIRKNNVSIDNGIYTFITGGEVLLDYGNKSASGNTSFDVAMYSGDIKLKICYSDRLLVFDYNEGKERGDNERGSCNYLGTDVILPVSPANPDRFEVYDIVRIGNYTYPLIEGQFRYMYISLIGSGKVEISNLRNINTSKNDVPIGGFSSSDKKLTALYEISARTIDIATVKSSQADYINGKLLIRELKDCNIIRYKNKLTDGLKVNLRYHFSKTNTLRQELKIIVLSFPDFKEITEHAVSIECMEKIYELDLCFKGGKLFAGNNLVYDTNNEKYSEGISLAFSQGEGNAWTIDACTIDDKKTDIASCFEYFKSDWFLSDGGKRDRLPWSGDLEWAGKSLYYTFNPNVMKSTLEIMLRFQNDEGFIHGCCYPECDPIKAIKERKYGLYESDIFSMWYIPVVYRYLQFTGDLTFIKGKYELLKKSLDYAICHIGDNGLFYQRKETSKGTWDNGLGSGSTNTYANILLQVSCSFFANISSELGYKENAIYFEEIAKNLKIKIEEMLFDENEGMYKKCLESPDIDNEASALALMFCFTSKERAIKISKNYKKTIFIYGKILSLLIEGLYNYDLEEEGYKIFTGHNEFSTSWGYSSFIDWYNLSVRYDCPHTTSECMLPPRIEDDKINCWGDLSHPDTAVNHILLGCMVGIKPTKFGFKECEFNPHMYGLDWVNGIVPTPYGDINVEISGDKCDITCPAEIEIINKSKLSKVNIYKVDRGNK